MKKAIAGLLVLPNRSPLQEVITKAGMLFVVTILFLFSLELVIASLKYLGKSTIEQYIHAAANPFVGLFIGLLATALVQSSTLITSLSVGLVASGALSHDNAIPIVMGANVGTTITCIMVSLGHIMQKKEFRKAFAGSMLHVFMNVFPLIILFPLEWKWGVLSELSHWTASFFATDQGALVVNHPFTFLGPAVSWAAENAAQQNALWFTLLISIIGLFLCIRWFVLLFRQAVIHNIIEKMGAVVFSNSLMTLFWGIVITALVHSSSVMISFAIALIATNKLSLQKAFPFMMGANIGTTLTAITAAFGKPEAALSLAFVHFWFNIFSVMMVLPIPFIQNQAILLSRRMGRMAIEYRSFGFVLVLSLFFLLPFLLIYISK